MPHLLPETTHFSASVLRRPEKIDSILNALPADPGQHLVSFHNRCYVQKQLEKSCCLVPSVLPVPRRSKEIFSQKAPVTMKFCILPVSYERADRNFHNQPLLANIC